MTFKVYEAALGIADPWDVVTAEFYEEAKPLTVLIDLKPGTRFAVSDGGHAFGL